MSTTAIRNEDATSGARVGQVDMKLEVITIPVSDIDRAKEFYGGLGWRLDADFKDGGERAVQLTPPGSQCSIHLGKKVAGPAQGLFLVVSDIEAARDDLVRHGVEVSEVFHFAEGPGPFGGVVRGLAPDHQSYGSYATFTDPDGNGWLLQEVTARLPGRVDADGTTFTSSVELAAALRRAATAHGEHEKLIGQHDEEWPDWYAEYMVREQAGRELPS
jgi:catechol 2,3-dioxygenase-like lactoylglutathione lyase family enzyme